MPRRLLPFLPLAGVLLLALALRVWGLGWGLPSATHYFSYHPDESVVLGAAMRMNALRGDLLPHFYNYGTLQLYLVNFANTLVFLFGNGEAVKDVAVQHEALARQYLVGRWLTVAMGAGTVWAVAAVGTRLWGRRAGLLAALTLAVMPLHAQHSHWLTVDVPATFWATLSLLWSARLATGDPMPARAALLAGLFAGLAAATKYNLALMLLPLMMACFRPPAPTMGSQEGRTRRLSPAPPLLGAGGAALAFLLACPGAVLDAAKFRADVGYEAYHVQHLPGAEFAHTGSGFVYHVARNMDAGLGLPLLLLCLISVGYALHRRGRGDGLLAAFALPYYVLIGLAVVRYARYIIPLLPILALWAGRLLADLSRLPHPATRRAGIALGGAVLLLTLGDALLLLHPMAGLDNRDVALTRVQQLEAGPVGFAVQPWFYSPPVSPWFTLPHTGDWRQYTAPAVAARIVYRKNWDIQTLRAARPPVVVLSEYDYDDALRQSDPAALAYLQALQQDYFRRSVIAGRSDLEAVHTSVDGMPTRGLPSDMLYPDPIITIYTRK